MELSERFWGSFYVMVCLTGLTFCIKTKSDTAKANTGKSDKFRDFQRSYLIVYLLAMFSDWLQGPYVYQLYVSYGFTAYEICLLFVGGFGSSLVFGTFIGSLADKYGRKKMCLLYSACYIIACLTKTVNDFNILMIGRVLCGISTSLLFSAFESWMVCEHAKRGFDPMLLSETFSYCTFGNGLAAVIAGLTANVISEEYGFTAPFVLAILPLSICGFLVSSQWAENYGEARADVGTSGLQQGLSVILKDKKIAALGLAQSCFEGAMYIFVFLWTPALKSSEEEAAERAQESTKGGTSSYLGVIFAVYMVCMMFGSSLYRIASDIYGQRGVRAAPLLMHAVALLAIGSCTMFYDSKAIVYYSFLLFEVCCGIFFPGYGVIKSAEIPEQVRSSVMNIFRIPVNLVVVLVLMQKGVHPQNIFGFCTGAHAIGLLCFYYYFKSAGGAGKEYKVLPTDDKV